MSLLDKVFTFDSDAEGFVFAGTTGDGSGGWSGPKAALYFTASGRRSDDIMTLTLTGTWESLFGVLSGTIVNSIQCTAADVECYTFNTGVSAKVGPIELHDGAGTSQGNLAGYTTFYGLGTNTLSASALSVPTALQASDSTIKIVINSELACGNDALSIVSVLFDNISLSLEGIAPFVFLEAEGSTTADANLSLSLEKALDISADNNSSSNINLSFIKTLNIQALNESNANIDLSLYGSYSNWSDIFELSTSDVRPSSETLLEVIGSNEVGSSVTLEVTPDIIIIQLDLNGMTLQVEAGLVFVSIGQVLALNPFPDLQVDVGEIAYSRFTKIIKATNIKWIFYLNGAEIEVLSLQMTLRKDGYSYLKMKTVSEINVGETAFLKGVYTSNALSFVFVNSTVDIEYEVINDGGIKDFYLYVPSFIAEENGERNYIQGTKITKESDSVIFESGGYQFYPPNSYFEYEEESYKVMTTEISATGIICNQKTTGKVI